MKSKSLRSIQITLTLDDLEANWLKDIMQNPIVSGQEVQLIDGFEESETDKTMRGIFFDALKKEMRL